MEAHLLPVRRLLPDLETAPVRDDLVQRLRMAPAVPPDQDEGSERSDQHHCQYSEQDVPVCCMRNRRGGVICERERSAARSAFDEVIDEVIEIGPFLDLRVCLIQ